MSQSPKAVLEAILADPTNVDQVGRLVAPDATYVSLNFSDAELKRVMPWAGTSKGPAGIVQTFIDVARYWNERKLEEIALFGDDRYAALFGRMTYRSTVLGKEVVSPFCVCVEVVDGICRHMQFMEDTFATTNSFRCGGEWRMQQPGWRRDHGVSIGGEVAPEQASEGRAVGIWPDLRVDQDTTLRHFDPEIARNYCRALLEIHRVFQLFWTRFTGKCSPINQIWGAFDVAVRRFSGRAAPRDPGGAPHMSDAVAREAYSREVSSAGFWPNLGGGAGPCFYSYAYPPAPSVRKHC